MSLSDYIFLFYLLHTLLIMHDIKMSLIPQYTLIRTAPTFQLPSSQFLIASSYLTAIGKSKGLNRCIMELKVIISKSLLINQVL